MHNQHKALRMTPQPPNLHCACNTSHKLHRQRSYSAERSIKLTESRAETTLHTQGARSSAAEARRSHPLSQKHFGHTSSVHWASDTLHDHEKQHDEGSNDVLEAIDSKATVSQPQATVPQPFSDPFTCRSTQTHEQYRRGQRQPTTWPRVHVLDVSPASTIAKDGCTTSFLTSHVGR